MSKIIAACVVLISLTACVDMSVLDGKINEKKIEKWAMEKNEGKLLKILVNDEVDPSLKDLAAYKLGLLGNPDIIKKVLVKYSVSMKTRLLQQKLIQTFAISDEAKSETFQNNFLAAHVDNPVCGGDFLAALTVAVSALDYKPHNTEVGALDFLTKGDGLWEKNDPKRALVQYLKGSQLTVRRGEAMEKTAQVLITLGYQTTALAYLQKASRADTSIIKKIRSNPLYAPLRQHEMYSLIIPPIDYILFSQRNVNKEKLNKPAWFRSFAESQPLGISTDGKFGLFSKKGDYFIVPFEQGDIIIKTMLATPGNKFKVDIGGTTVEFVKLQRKDMGMKVEYPDLAYDKPNDMWIFNRMDVYARNSKVASMAINGSFLIKQNAPSYVPYVAVDGSYFVVFVPVEYSNELQVATAIFAFKKID